MPIAAPPLTPADVAAFGMLGFAVFSWSVVQVVKAFRTKVRDVAAEVATDATVAQRLQAIEGKLDTLTAQITKTNDNHVVHEVDCAKFRGETVAELRAFNKTLSEHGRSMGQMQSQIRMVVTGGANKLFEVGADTA